MSLSSGREEGCVIVNYKKILSSSYFTQRFNHYAETVIKETGLSKSRLYFDFFLSHLISGCTIKDYFLYRFYEKNYFGKRYYATGKYLEKYLSKVNDPSRASELKNKERTLILFSEFMKRDWCGQNYQNTLEQYQQFSEKHTQGIVKPLENCGGHGVRIISTQEAGEGEVSLYEFCKSQHLLIEELIIQHEKMHELYPKAINTIRYITLNAKPLGAVLRMGIGGSNIDNASSGGMYAAIDLESCTVQTPAFQYEGQRYQIHPDTNIIIPGFEIPMWKECEKFVKDACELISGIPLIGWDIAITPNGPTLVEVNEAPDLFLLQHPLQQGLRKILEN